MRQFLTIMGRSGIGFTAFMIAAGGWEIFSGVSGHYTGSFTPGHMSQHLALGVTYPALAVAAFYYTRACFAARRRIVELERDAEIERIRRGGV